MRIVIVIFMAFSLCTVKSDDDCTVCKDYVAYLGRGELPPQINTLEKFAKYLQDLCPHQKPGSLEAQFCKSLNEHYYLFAQGYFQYREHEEVNTCWVAQVCPGP
ncbi:hypothetical protein Ddc_24056 [Ditylenchus destructor]|nr:hypothetical protein Ddc_24056 [Ditylenchus destructor]